MSWPTVGPKNSTTNQSSRDLPKNIILKKLLTGPSKQASLAVIKNGEPLAKPKALLVVGQAMTAASLLAQLVKTAAGTMTK